jgi:6-pyruvoyltetrahydropterin/6-carboxytetrahydropterin synthase
MYVISVEDTFDAAHCLPDYEGSCKRLHGHTYRVQIEFMCADVDESGMAIDFRQAKQLLRSTLEYFDHQYINDLPEFSNRIPTAENIARFIYDRIKTKNARLRSVSVWETPTSRATYYED